MVALRDTGENEAQPLAGRGKSFSRHFWGSLAGSEKITDKDRLTKENMHMY